MPLPEQFRYDPDEDSAYDDAATEGDTPETPEAILPEEPVGEPEEVAEEPAEEEQAASPKLTVDEWADILLAPDSEQRIAEAPAALRGQVVKAYRQKLEAQANQSVQLAARDAYSKGIEEGRNALARDLLVQQVDQMDPHDRQAFFEQNREAETVWHAAKAKVPEVQASPFVEQIREQGRAQLQRLEGHPEYQAVFAEMTQSKYNADPAGLAALTSRVERALASTPTNAQARDEAEAKQTEQAAKLLKSVPRTTRLGAGGAAAGPLTMERLNAMTPAEVSAFEDKYGTEQIDRLLSGSR